MKKLNLILNIFLICLSILNVALFIYFIASSTTEIDSQREIILQCMEEKSFMGMTVDECKLLLGEPFIERETALYFDGGSEHSSLGFITWYEQYELRLYINEQGMIEDTWYDYTLDIIY